LRCVDTNVLVYAHRPESPAHERFRRWLESHRAGNEALGLPSVVASGFLRIVTHPKVFNQPTPIETAAAFVEELRNSPSVTILEPLERHLGIFLDLCRRTGAIGNRVPDAYLAAIAIEHGATLMTADRGFARYPGLRWEHLLTPATDVASDRGDVRDASEHADHDADREDR
jgi:uncharacterized protein